MSVYQYCSKCGGIKDLNKNSYCKSCSREYFRGWRLDKAKSKNVSNKDLKIFVEKVISNNFDVGFNDLNEIINFYGDVTDNIEEFNDLPTNQQIVGMWETIYRYYKGNIL